MGLRAWWHDRQRNIFQFWDGTRYRRIDPIVVYRGLMDHPQFSWDDHPKVAENISSEHEMLRKDALRSFKVIADAVREVFGIPHFDGKRGLTEEESLGLFGDFCEYMGLLKKSTDPPQTSPQPTEPDAGQAVDQSATNSTSECGSTSNASDCDSLPA